MITKYLERKIVIEKNSENNSGSPMEIEYYLIESEPEYTNELNEKKLYGISVVKRVTPVCFEEKTIYELSSCIVKTKRVIDILADNSVTPVGLKPVLEDMVGILIY